MFMDNFHLMEVIHRGKYSTVYKGRKKEHYKKIYAIKSVDKSHKNTVLQEVRILRCLDHSNVVKFYDWYETSAYSRLILEYCGGGDLHTLLELDSKLPEDSVCDIARDIVTALRYLHSKGIIHGDLKPSNILFDVNGCTKLCDFGLSKELSDISKTPSSLEEGEGNKRGSPCYMAPELFKDGGVHSYASDLWALGCVLYECYAGRPPFIGTEFTQIVKSILTDPTPSLPGNPSRPFANLVTRLLNKDPTLRIRWSEIRTHAFWKSHPLPPEPPFFNQNQNPNIPNIVENIEIENGDTELEVNENLSEVLWHESDLMVQPVIPSPRPKSEEHRLHILGSLSFGTVSSSDVLESPKDHLEGVTELIATILNKNNNTIVEEQKNVIRFVELLSTDVTAANILSNSLIMPILVKMLRESKTCGLRVQLAALLGRIIRHSTLFNANLADSGIFDALNEGLIDFRQKKVRRFSMAALGELLFHISDDSKATSTSETPCQVPNTSISLVTSLLRKEEDDKTQLYALRTIENMTSVGKYWATLFTTQDVINNLCDIFQSSNKQEPTRMAAGSCLVRLVRFTPPTIQQLMEKLTFKELAISISKQNPSQKQQICLNLLNMALIDRNFFPDIEHKNLVPNIVF